MGNSRRFVTRVFVISSVISMSCREALLHRRATSAADGVPSITEGLSNRTCSHDFCHEWATCLTVSPATSHPPTNAAYRAERGHLFGIGHRA